MDIVFENFIWDADKEKINIKKHGISFIQAIKVFKDPRRKVLLDKNHITEETRYYCIGKVEHKIITVRFVYRDNKIRIFGAGFWRKGRKYYEKKIKL